MNFLECQRIIRSKLNWTAAEVMARKKQGEVAEKVMYMERMRRRTVYFKYFAYCSGISFAFLYLKGKSGLVKTQLEVKWKRMKDAKK